MSEQQVIEEAKRKATTLLSDSKAFDAEFEKIFQTFDANKDGEIGAGEYVNFFNLMLGGKLNIARAMLNFDRADKNKDETIEKEEFKKEVRKRLKEFVNNQK